MELSANPSPLRQAYAADTPSTRPRIANGKSPSPSRQVSRPKTRQGKERLLTLDALDGRSAAFLAATKLVNTLTNDCGGAEHVSVGEQQLIKRAALLGALIEDFEVRWIAGEQIPLGDYFAAINTQHRVLTTLGLKRRPKDVLTLETYLQSRHQINGEAAE